jgi:hypothetical protein
MMIYSLILLNHLHASSLTSTLLSWVSAYHQKRRLFTPWDIFLPLTYTRAWTWKETARRALKTLHSFLRGIICRTLLFSCFRLWGILSILEGTFLILALSATLSLGKCPHLPRRLWLVLMFCIYIFGFLLQQKHPQRIDWVMWFIGLLSFKHLFSIFVTHKVYFFSQIRL